MVLLSRMEDQLRKGETYTGVTVCYACHDGEGNFVFPKRGERCRDEHGVWDAGGGGVDFGISVEETLRKEIKEEYCTDAISHEFLGYRDLFRDQGGKKTHWVTLDFKVLVDPLKVSNGEPHKFDDVAWFRLDRLPTLMHSGWPAFFGKYRDILLNVDHGRTEV